MAVVKLRDAVVERVFYNGKGFAVVEKFTRSDGEPGSTPFTVWFEEPPVLEVGDSASFSGLYSDRVEEYERKDGTKGVAIRRNLNSAKIEGDVVSAPVAPGEEPF